MAQYLIGVSVPLTLMAVLAIGRWVRRILNQLQQVHALAVGVDKAVNRRPFGDPTIYEMVKENGEASARLEEQFRDHAANDEYNFADLRQRLPQPE